MLGWKKRVDGPDLPSSEGGSGEKAGGEEIGGGNGGDDMGESDEQAGKWDVVA